MLDEKLNSYVATYESAAWYLRGWLAICLPAYCGLTPSMNNNDAGYVNYETIIYSVGRVGYCIEVHRAYDNRSCDSILLHFMLLSTTWIQWMNAKTAYPILFLHDILINNGNWIIIFI